MTSRMRAIVQTGYGSSDLLELREIEKPVAQESQVLVRIRAASVNAADWHLTAGMPRLIGRFLCRPGTVRGFDLSGTVESAGAKVTRFRPGDDVFGTGPGSFAEYVATTEERLAAKPRTLGFEQAAALPIAGVTALQGLRDRGGLRAGQRVLIYGAGGGVGTFAVQIAHALGAHVTAVTRTGSLDLVRSLGADEVIDYTREDFTKRGRSFDLLLDIGADRSLGDCGKVLVPGGAHVIAGAPRRLRAIVWRLLAAQVSSRIGRRRVGTYMARVKHDGLIALKDLAEAGKLDPVLDRRFPLAEAAEAVRYVGTAGARGKVVITVA